MLRSEAAVGGVIRLSTVTGNYDGLCGGGGINSPVPGGGGGAGGGSSYSAGTDTIHTQGFQAGNGMIVLEVINNDNDGDGVSNDKDVCPNTPAGEVVDASGCSINQLCPCNGLWKNHGEYVSCVSQTSNDFVAAGLITQAERAIIVSQATQSSCGR